MIRLDHPPEEVRPHGPLLPFYYEGFWQYGGIPTAPLMGTNVVEKARRFNFMGAAEEVATNINGTNAAPFGLRAYAAAL